LRADHRADPWGQSYDLIEARSFRQIRLLRTCPNDRSAQGESGGSLEVVIVWLNGTHGVGKTTTSVLVQKLVPDSRVFDAEKVGETLMGIAPGLPATDNFQAQEIADSVKGSASATASSSRQAPGSPVQPLGKNG
jgi:hypothetical protein